MACHAVPIIYLFCVFSLITVRTKSNIVNKICFKAFFFNIFARVNRLVSNHALLLPDKGAKSSLRGIKHKKIQIMLLNLDLDLLFRISKA